MVDETDIQAVTLDRIAEKIEELADDVFFIKDVLDATDSDGYKIVQKLIRDIADEVLDLR